MAGHIVGVAQALFDTTLQKFSIRLFISIRLFVSTIDNRDLFQDIHIEIVIINTWVVS